MTTEMHCSFCGKSQHEVQKLVAGPSVFICSDCLHLCMNIIEEKISHTQAEAGGPHHEASAPNPTKLYCSFCGKSQNEVQKILAGPSVFICDECVRLCMPIINEVNKSAPDKNGLEEGKAVITRKVELLPQFTAAFMTVLAFAVSYLQRQYTYINIEIKITIQGQEIQLQITVLKAMATLISAELGCLGAVMKGRVAPDQYLKDPVIILELDSQLSVARTQLKDYFDRSQLKNLTSLKKAIEYNEEETLADFTGVLAYFFD